MAARRVGAMAEPAVEAMDVEEDMEMTEEEVWMLLLVSTTPFVAVAFLGPLRCYPRRAEGGSNCTLCRHSL